MFWFLSSFISPFFSPFSCSPLYIVFAGDGGNGMRWIFNGFVSGSTMGGGIVVNIITYRSLQLHFPRPCHAGAITHSSQPHHHRTYTYYLLAAGCDSACLHGFTMFIFFLTSSNPHSILGFCLSASNAVCTRMRLIWVTHVHAWD